MAGHEIRVRTRLISLLFTLCIAAAPQSHAQDTVPVEQGADVDDYFEEIVVTGSRIKRRDFVTPSPLTTIDSELIATSGQPTIEETLNQMPQVLPGLGRTSNHTIHPDVGTATVNLRGLGAGRSLVLLNSRRLPASGTSSAVDLNTIPQFLIDRVEIITGGTSTVYGSDAIAGVVNFITRDDFDGLGVDVGLSMAEQGDAESYNVNIAYGHNFADGQGNLTVYASVLEREALLGGAREHTRVPLWDDWEQGILVPGGSYTIPAGLIGWPLADLGNGPVEVMFNPDGTPREFVEPDDRYNFSPVSNLQVPLNRLTIGLMGNFDLSERFEAYLEASFVSNELTQRLASTGAWGIYTEVNLDNPLLAPETQLLLADNYACDTNLACFFYFKRLLEMGPRLSEFERDQMRVVAGIRGELWGGWEIDGWVTYANESTTRYLRNDASESRLLQGLLVNPVTNGCLDPTGGCVPLNVFGENNLSPEGVEFIRYADFRNELERTHKLASVYVTGSPLDTWAGPLDIAVGLDWRSDETHFKSDNVLFSGDTLGWGPRLPVDGTEELTEVYAEAIVPLASDLSWADYLGLEVGARYSNYEHADGDWTYKAGAEWQPVDGLRLRAMSQHSVRAPNSHELFEEQITETWTFAEFESSEDPCSASADPRGNGFLEKCVLQGLPADEVGVWEATVQYPMDYIWGGNPNLRPEVADTWTLGAVISPVFLPKWHFTIDYFEFEVEDTIGPIDVYLICFDPVNTSHSFCENMVRDGSGNVTQMTELTSNRGLLETTGIDTQVQYRAELPDFLSLGGYGADINVNVYWTHILTNKEQEHPATEVLDCAGYFGRPCNFRADTFPENRVTSNVQYSTGSLALYLTWRWIEGTRNAAPIYIEQIWGVTDPNLAIPEVDDEHYLDFGLSYAFNDQFSANFGVNNVLDNDPPQMADAVRGPNTDAGLYDVFGRSYYMTLSARF
ncbi:MAG: TonB-dependent receptor domain-containing protein [Woeseiaceae bacterium]